MLRVKDFTWQPGFMVLVEAELEEAGWDAAAELLEQVELEVVDIETIPESVIPEDAALLALEFFAEAAIEEAPEPVDLVEPESTAVEIILTVQTAEAEAQAADAEAEAQALVEWRQISEESQQSSDPSKISAQQSSDLGRILLAFATSETDLIFSIDTG